MIIRHRFSPQCPAAGDESRLIMTDRYQGHSASLSVTLPTRPQLFFFLPSWWRLGPIAPLILTPLDGCLWANLFRDHIGQRKPFYLISVWFVSFSFRLSVRVARCCCLLRGLLGPNPVHTMGIGQGTPWMSCQLIAGPLLTASATFGLKDTSTCSRDSNLWPSDHQSTSSTYWATAAPVYDYLPI